MLVRVRVALARVRELFRGRSRVAAEQSEEFSFHVEMETAENVRRGMTEPDARRAAILRFGGTQRFREETRDARGVAALDNLARDTRFAFRRLHRAPAFAAGVIATLGIGIGAAVGIGTIVYGVLLRDLPYHDPGQLARVGFVTEGIASETDLQSAATYFYFATSARSFSGLGSYVLNDNFALTDGDAAERVTVALATPATFTLLGVRPLLGQLFLPGDTSWSERSDHRLLPVLLSENLWRRRYGSDPSIIGRRIDIDHGEREVVGVLPRSFAFPSPSVDLYYPAPTPVRQPGINLRYLDVIGRLRAGTAPAAAEAELNALLPRITGRFPAITPAMLHQSHAHVTVVPLKRAIVAQVRPQLVLLGVLVAVVLLIAATNVVSLFLLRTERASQEIAIALSLGATKLALAQRFTVEGVVLGLASALVALPAAALIVTTKFGFTEREIPRLSEVSFTWQAAAVVLACATLIGSAVGLIALTRTGAAGLLDGLRSARSTASRAWRRAQNGLVAFQVAIAVVLLVAAGLLGRSFWNLRQAKIGFDPQDAMTFHVSLPWSGYTSYAADVEFYAKVMDRLAALPGVTSVGAASRIPLAGVGDPFKRPVQAGDGSDRPVVATFMNMASSEYFRTMGIPLRAGRTFRAGDLHDSGILVSERLAMSAFGTTDVVGRHLVNRTDVPSTYTIVGVVGDVPWARIEDGGLAMLYFPIQRDGDGAPDNGTPAYPPTDAQFVIRSTQLPAAATIQRIVSELDRRVPASNVRTLTSLVDDATARVRLTMLLIATAGGAALLLGVIGVYSVVAYAANGRMREFGIRLALGAAPARVGGLVLSDGVRLVGIGILAGLVAALGATRFLRVLLYEVTPTSAEEFGAATILVVGVSLLAILLPARRAARTHPAVVLRGD
ncbi:MAG TPA: ADOP family duplicated permease [Gemmatimonadaceae bacterium]